MVKIFFEKLIEKGWKQIDIARHTGLHTVFVHKLTHGAKCSIDTAILIADAFNVSVDEVLGRTPSKPRSPRIEKINQITAGNIEFELEILRCAEDKKLIKEMRGAARRGKAA